MSEDYDVVVVGGGPGGCRVAEGTAGRGYRTLILEEHPAVGLPVRCAGLVSPRTAREVALPSRAILAEMRGAVIIGPDIEFSFESRDVRGLVIDRKSFDQWCCGRALRAGAEIRLRTRATDVRDGEVVIEDGTIQASVVVGADGPPSIVRRRAGLRGLRYVFASMQQDMPGWDGPEDMVAIIADQEIAPGFFAWGIPHGDGARVGTAVAPGTMPAGKSLERAIERFRSAGLLTSKAATGITGGGIPIGPLRTVSIGSTLVVGDAAGQVKPLSGGGLFPSISAADIAAAAIDGYLTGDSPLREYDRNWRRRFGGELSFGLKAREAYMRMSNAHISRILQIFARDEVRTVISTHGDIDHPSILSGPLVKTAPDIVGEVARTILGDALSTLMRRLGMARNTA